MENKVRNALRKVLKEFLDTSKSRVDMTKVVDADMIAFEKAMTYAASFVNSQEVNNAAGSSIAEHDKQKQHQSLVDLFFEENE
jgi:hypothetical protein